MSTKTIRSLAFLFLILALASCATPQMLSIETEPPGAMCAFSRQGKNMGSIYTPGEISVQRDKHDLSVVCKKEGYTDAAATITSSYHIMSAVNHVLDLNPVGFVTDAFSGDDDKYTTDTTIKLEPLPPPPQGQAELVAQPAAEVNPGTAGSASTVSQ